MQAFELQKQLSAGARDAVGKTMLLTYRLFFEQLQSLNELIAARDVPDEAEGMLFDILFVPCLAKQPNGTLCV